MNGVRQIVINTYIYNDAKCCPSLLETVCIPVLTRNIRNFTMFTCSSSHWLSHRRASAANAVSKSAYIYTNLRLNLTEPVWLIFYLFLVIGCFQLTQSFQPHYGPEVDSASNRNEYQESSWAYFLGNLEASTSHEPMVLHGLLQGQLYLFILAFVLMPLLCVLANSLIGHWLLSSARK
jgi:hypothetical protein